MPEDDDRIMAPFTLPRVYAGEVPAQRAEGS